MTRVLAVAMHEVVVDELDTGHGFTITIGHGHDGATGHIDNALATGHDQGRDTGHDNLVVASNDVLDEDTRHDNRVAATGHDQSRDTGHAGSTQLNPDTEKIRALQIVQADDQQMTASHRDRIKAVIQKSQAEGRSMTYQQIADEAVVGRSTVKKYAHAIFAELHG